MKKLLLLLTIFASCLGCSKDTVENDGSIRAELPSLIFGDGSAFQELTFTADGSWTATMLNASDGWCRISPACGDAGTTQLKVQVLANNRKSDREITLVLRTETGRCDIPIVQVGSEQIETSEDHLLLQSRGGTLEFTVQSNVRLSFEQDASSREWITLADQSAPADFRGMTPQTFRLVIGGNNTTKDLKGKFTLSGSSKKQSLEVTVVGTNNEINYESTDFSADGDVGSLQKATKGSGIDIILMGDGFTDRQVADGTYAKIIRKAANAFFSVEPYKSFRTFFNVYVIKAISLNQGFFEQSQTALKTYFGMGTKVGGDNDICMEYAMKVPGMTTEKMEDALIIVMLNSDRYAGTTYMSYPSGRNDYGKGRAIAYFPLSADETMFEELLHHEAGGHGFAKLADEYTANTGTSISQSAIDSYRQQEQYGWVKNIDFTADANAVKWNWFITNKSYNELYRSEKLGAFEGAGTYDKGAYRPTVDGIMRSNKGQFNAPSREAIYYRIHKLAYGNFWEYDRDAFVKYDAINRASVSAPASRAATAGSTEPLHPPVIF